MIVCRVRLPDGVKHYVTCLPQQLAFERGLPPEAIVGELLEPLEPGATITPEVFDVSPVFVDFLHSVIARRGPGVAGLIAEAQRQRDGWVYIIDQRIADADEHIPPEDILGVFEVMNGQILPNSYQRSPKHLILSASGFFQLGSELQSCLLEELTNLMGAQ